jgi:COMPASS component BRE2
MIRARKRKSSGLEVGKVRVKAEGAKQLGTSTTPESETPSAEAQETEAEMSTSASASPQREPQREATPSNPTPISTLSQKRALEDDHQPAVSSPLNPDFKPSKPQDDAALGRERAPRAKKESLKKRESKGGSLAPESSARATPDPKASASQKQKKNEAPAPMRYKLPPPKTTDFEAPRGPIFIPSHTKVAPDGSIIQFNETTDQ